MSEAEWFAELERNYAGVSGLRIEIECDELPCIGAVLGGMSGDLTLGEAAESLRAVMFARGLQWCGKLVPLGGDIVVALDCFVEQSSSEGEIERLRERVDTLRVRMEREYAPRDREVGEPCATPLECRSTFCLAAEHLAACDADACCARGCDMSVGCPAQGPAGPAGPTEACVAKSSLEAAQTSPVGDELDQLELTPEALGALRGHLASRGVCAVPREVPGSLDAGSWGPM